MTRILVFCLMVPFALIEMFLYHRYDVVLVGTLYFALCVQADFAAGRYAREFFRAPEREPEAEPESEELHVPPLGAPRARAEPAKEKPRLPPSLPPEPNFRGRAHEVLGVRENAATRTIVNAFRRLAKRFHPDQARGLPAEMANERMHKISEAKERLLERRRSRRAA